MLIANSRHFIEYFSYSSLFQISKVFPFPTNKATFSIFAYCVYFFGIFTLPSLSISREILSEKIAVSKASFSCENGSKTLVIVENDINKNIGFEKLQELSERKLLILNGMKNYIENNLEDLKKLGNDVYQIVDIYK